MSYAQRRVWGLNLVLLMGMALIVLATVSLAYSSGGPPSFIGHSSDEILFTYAAASLDCTAFASAACTVMCPSGTFLVAGWCGSSTTNPVWTSLGLSEADRVSYTCVEATHVPGVQFIASATCMQGVFS